METIMEGQHPNQGEMLHLVGPQKAMSHSGKTHEKRVTVQVWRMVLSISQEPWVMPEHTADLLSCWMRRGSKTQKRWWSIVPTCVWKVSEALKSWEEAGVQAKDRGRWRFLSASIWWAMWKEKTLGNLVLLFYLLFSCLLSGALMIVSLGRVGGVKGMVTFGDSWIQEYNEAGKLADDIIYMISERNSLPATGPEAQRHSSLIRRKITILGFRLDSLQSIDSKLPGKQHLTEKEMNRRKDMLANLKSKATEMASTLNMSNFANRDSLLGPETKAADATSRTTGLDNYEQDEGLEKLEESMMSFKHIALAVNEELDLQTRLIATLDEHVDVTDSRLQVTILLLLQQLMQT
ncbi:hypothetical protein H5410_060123 [Solanum commersonii]|uniref:t-SNARE coiled-coil homology domain-containing protein n=1 Tax=Solanum commersonii TaxID=4109 RepID=A0A9J5W486_SOLCO|nr:hypothetical protein H5410_060123 [Solanum commersonii]